MSPPAYNVGRAVHDAARAYPDAIALVHGDAAWTWRDIDNSVDALACALSDLGVAKGDRVFVQTPNNRAAFETVYAIAKIGAVGVPINFRSTPVEAAELADICQPKVFIAHASALDCAVAASEKCRSITHIISIGEALASARHAECIDYEALIAAHMGVRFSPVAVEHDDIWRLAFTSGTTGRPKALMNNFGQIGFALVNRLADIMPGLSHEDGFLAIGPLSHGSGTVAMVNALRGAKTVMLSTSHFDEVESFALIQQHRLTTLFCVPTMLMRLVDHEARARHDLSSLRYVIYAGAPITRSDQKRAIEIFAGSLYQYYGSGECLGHGTVLTPAMHSVDDDSVEAPPGTVGLPRSGAELEIMDEHMNPVPDGQAGEICMRGPGVFTGYYNDVEANAASFKDGWFRTGDLGRRDERGFVFIVGRSKEMYKSGGLQVYPNETENYLARHPAVREAYVLAVPDSRWGEVGVAIVTLREGQAADEAALKAHLRNCLAGYKQPKRIFIWPEIAKTAYGKVPKGELRAQLYQRGHLVEGEDVR